jgi:site-specific DNA-methyltransferase (adenine-specific)
MERATASSIELEEVLNKVIEGDVLETLRALPDESVDLGITSPPYNKKGKGGGWLVLTWLLNTRWTLWQEIVWDRGIAGNIRGWRFWQVEERIYWLTKGKPKELAPKHAKLTSVWRIPPETGHREHPAVFPLELPARIIHSVLEERPGVVIDPFCGTGTTLVAAKLLGKEYIGIEIDPYYVMYARKRLEAAESELPKINKELRLHFTRETFQEKKARGIWRRKIQGARGS